MKKKNANDNVVKGNLLGGDIEPGTFHVHNASGVSDNCSELPVSEEFSRDDLEVASVPDALISTAEASVTF